MCAIALQNAIVASLFHHSVRHYTRDMAEILYMVGQLDGAKLHDWLQFTVAHMPQRHGLCATKEQLHAAVGTITGWVQSL